MTNWISTLAADDIDQEEVARFDHGSQIFAYCLSPNNKYYVTNGLRAHEKIHLANGLVKDHTIA